MSIIPNTFFLFFFFFFLSSSLSEEEEEEDEDELSEDELESYKRRNITCLFCFATSSYIHLWTGPAIRGVVWRVEMNNTAKPV